MLGSYAMGDAARYALIVFLVTFPIEAVTGPVPTLTTFRWMAALIAAIAMVLRK